MTDDMAVCIEDFMSWVMDEVRLLYTDMIWLESMVVYETLGVEELASAMAVTVVVMVSLLELVV